MSKEIYTDLEEKIIENKEYDGFWYRILPEESQSELMWEVTDTKDRKNYMICCSAKHYSLNQAIERLKQYMK